MTPTPMSPVVGEVPVLDRDEAVAVARELAGRFAEGSADRDANRSLPLAELAELTASGLLAISVPRAHGGAELPVATVTEVVRLLSVGDPNVGQLPHSHFVHVNSLRLGGNAEIKALLFAEVMAGRRFGNAQAEIASADARKIRTTLFRDGAAWRLRGAKGYCTGALLADWIPVLAHLEPDGPIHVAWVERRAPGVTVQDDWDGIGQRTTASGTVLLDDVRVEAARVVPWARIFESPTTYGAYAQVLHAAIDAGIARAALQDGAAFLRACSRPSPEAGVGRAGDDPLVIHAFGEMEILVRSAEALLAQAADEVDRANATLTAEACGVARLSVATARAVTADAAVTVANRLFEALGTRSALTSVNLDRHWRNARIHTLHDAGAWKVQHLGRFAIDGVVPTGHGQL